MEISNLNLVSKNGNNTVASVELSDKGAASEYFGTWYKTNATLSDVVGWCKERIAIYERYIANLKTVMATSTTRMCEAMSNEELEAILANRKKAKDAPAEAQFYANLTGAALNWVALF